MLESRILWTSVILLGTFGCVSSSLESRAPSSTRTQIKVSDFAAELDRQGKMDALMGLADARLKEMISDPVSRVAAKAYLESIRRTKDWKKLDHFPSVSVQQMNRLRPALGGLGGADNESVQMERFSGRLEDFLSGPCTEESPYPPPVHPSMPEVTNGHFADASLDACTVHQSFKVAKILNSLVRSDGSEIRHGAERARSAQKFFELLINSGHKVEMRNERTYANFLSLNAGENPIIWPVWIDTGLKTTAGEEIQVPVGHSHHAWHISGPVVNARVMFYLGISGVGFFAQVDERPAWTGTRAAYTYSSRNSEGREAILEAAEVAGKYYRRIQHEAAHYAQGMPADGYGYLGVCNDSNAVLEAATHSDASGAPTVSTYPLVRAKDLDSKPSLRDGLDDLLKGLPKDSEKVSDRKDTLRRILEMFPFESLSDRDVHDEALRRQMKAVENELR